MERIRPLVGIAVLIGIAWLCSARRRRFPTRIVVWGLALQFAFCLLVLGAPAWQIKGPLLFLFKAANDAINATIDYTLEGAEFVFGSLGRGFRPLTVPSSLFPEGDKDVVEIDKWLKKPGDTVFLNEPIVRLRHKDATTAISSPVWGTLDKTFITEPGKSLRPDDVLGLVRSPFIFATQVLPTIIFVGALMSVLYHVGVMQKVTYFFAVIMQRTMKTSGAETLAAAANIFVGQTEAPLIIKPFVAAMTRSELLCVMVGGMANTAGGVMAAYVGMLRDRLPDIAGHLLTASILSAPAALLISKIMIPETETPETMGKIPKESSETPHANVLDAAAAGASEGLHLALNVGAMLIAFIALIAMANGILGSFGDWIATKLSKEPPHLSLQLILGYVFAPLVWVVGVPREDIVLAGSFLGEKTILNEFVAYLDLAKNADKLSDRGFTIMSYCLSGFANFSSIAIQIGGIAPLAPHRRGDLARLGIRAVIGGTLATLMTAAVVALVI